MDPAGRSALDKLRTFRTAYLASHESAPLTVLDVGSAIAHPAHDSNRTIMENPAWSLQGLDIEAAVNVDIVVAEPYDWREVPSGSVDVVTCSQVFDHAEYFWITMLEIGRVLKVNGVAFINAPGSGPLQMAAFIDGVSAGEVSIEGALEGRTQEFPIHVTEGEHWVAIGFPKQFEGLPTAYGGKNPSLLTPPPARRGVRQPTGNCWLSADSGLPALAVPGAIVRGFPSIGIDLLGRPSDESTLLALARLLPPLPRPPAATS